MPEQSRLLRLSFEHASSSDIWTTMMMVRRAAARLGIEAAQIHEENEPARPSLRTIEISANEDRLHEMIRALTGIPGIGLVTIERAAISGEAAT